MALKLSLKANERVIAGGAVVRNATGRTIVLMVESEAPLLREKEILSEAKADTPCKRVYFVIQLMYIDGKNLPRYQKLYWALTREILNAAPSTNGMFQQISEAIYNNRYYEALKETRKLIHYEARAMAHARTRSGG